MNCQSCRQNLQPFLDDELAVNENVEVLEHVTKCAPCQEVFAAEKRIWESVRSRLSRETCPAEAGTRMLAAVRGESRSWWRRPWIWTIPAAAAAAILLILDPFRGGGKQAGGVPGTLVASGRKAVAAEREHEPTLHGELLGWTGVKYDELVDGLPDGAVLTAANLKSAVPPYRALAPLEEFQKAVKSKLGSSFSLPKEFLAGGRVVGGEVLEWHGGWIPQVIVEYGDRELALYEISKCQSEQFGMCFQRLLPSLHSVERDTGRQVRIDACKGCDAILVLRKGRAYILISRHGRDWDDGWMLDRARRLLD